ncbi:MAG: cyclic nucleotide-binding domain-containing protein [Leptospiraceae bacterium]|nr:cyclic nucleotide-binding domain-containing protein [Leptospiraceae bacterium]
MRNLINYPRGARIIISGQENPGYIYILKSGEIKIDSKIKFIQNNLNHYYPGDSFGFVSGILKKNHQDTLLAATNCEVVRMNIESFIEFMKNNHEIFLRFISQNSTKLRIFLDNIEEELNHSKEVRPERLFFDAKIYAKLGKMDFAKYALKKYLISNFSVPKDEEFVTKAEKYLATLEAEYTLPSFEEYVDGSGMLVKKNDILFVENEPDDYFYLIKEGSIRISKLVEDQEYNLDIIGKDQFFGEMAILNKTVRSATASAYEDSVLIRLSSENFFQKLDTDLLTRIFHQFARRLWLASKRFYLKQIDDPIAKFYIMLSALMEDIEQDKSSPNKVYTIKISAQEVGKMIGEKKIDKTNLSEIFLDNNIKINQSNIQVFDKKILSDKSEVLQKKFDRKMKEVIL